MIFDTIEAPSVSEERLVTRAGGRVKVKVRSDCRLVHEHSNDYI